MNADKYEGHTKEQWCARNLGDGSPMSCDEKYDHDTPFMETEADDGHNPAIGYMVGGEYSHSLEERRANIKLMADAPKLLADNKRLREAIADIATNMEAADGEYMAGFIEDLWKVIE